jgi:hypothetical protein
MSGPIPGSRCTVCNHPNHGAIDAALAGGRSSRLVAKDFNVGHDAVNRHKANHLAPALASSAPWTPKSGQSREEALDEIISAVASGKMRPDQAAQIRIALKEKDEAGGPADLTVRVADVPGLADLFADVSDALAPWPKAHEAVLAALKKHGWA